MKLDIVDLAHQIIDMHEELMEARQYKHLYMEAQRERSRELDESIAHGKHMLGGILQIAMTPGVLDAISTANRSPQ